MDKITLTKVINPTTQEVLPGQIDFEVADLSGVSDGYHSMEELYEFRKAFNVALFNVLAFHYPEHRVHKSKRHNDGEECFGGGWFIVMATLPSGQVSNHYRLEDWDLFKCEEKEKADKWDGHTSGDVIKRLKNLC